MGKHLVKLKTGFGDIKMSKLRDKIAIAALQGMIDYMGCDPEAIFHRKTEKNKHVLSKSAYAYADAMLKERKK